MSRKNQITFIAAGVTLLFVLFVFGYFTYHIGYWTRGESVYYGYFFFKNDFKRHCDTLKNADRNSFERLDRFWAKDKEHVYHFGKTTHLDAGSFELLDRHFVRDSAGIHFACYRNEDILLGNDVEILSFEWLHRDSQRSLAADSRHIYIIDETSDYSSSCVSYELARPLVPVDGSYDFYLTDSVSVFCVYGKIKGADPSTFAPIGVRTPYQHNSYAFDATHVYYNNLLLPDADPSSFREVNAFWVDANHVYIGATIVEGADPSTVSVVPTYSWSAATKELREVEPVHTFVRDSRHVFSTSHWATDNISLADPESFVVLTIESDHMYAFDKNGFYMMHDTAAFQEFRDWCLTSGDAPRTIVEALPHN